MQNKHSESGLDPNMDKDLKDMTLPQDDISNSGILNELKELDEAIKADKVKKEFLLRLPKIEKFNDSILKLF